MSGVRLSRAYLPGMMERRWGRVIFISSESGLNIPADMIHYGMTKTAMLAISRGLAKRAAGTGVTVNAILPGPTLSDGVVEMLKDADRGDRPAARGGRRRLRHRQSAQLHHPPPRQRGGSGQHGRLCRFRPRPRRRQAPRCASMAASSTRLHDPAHESGASSRRLPPAPCFRHPSRHKATMPPIAHSWRAWPFAIPAAPAARAGSRPISRRSGRSTTATRASSPPALRCWKGSCATTGSRCRSGELSAIVC